MVSHKVANIFFFNKGDVTFVILVFLKQYITHVNSQEKS